MQLNIFVETIGDFPIFFMNKVKNNIIYLK